MGTLVKYLFSLWVLSFLSDPKELTIRFSQQSGGIGRHTCGCMLHAGVNWGKWSVRRLLLGCVEVWDVNIHVVSLTASLWILKPKDETVKD